MPAVEKLLDHANHPTAAALPDRTRFEAVLELRRQGSAVRVGASVAVATHRFGEDPSQTWQRAGADDHVDRLQDGNAEPIRSAEAGAIAIRGPRDGSSEPRDPRHGHRRPPVQSPSNAGNGVRESTTRGPR